MNSRNAVFAGAVLGFIGVACGSFGAHGLSENFTRRSIPVEEQRKKLDTWEIGARYQMYHAIALLVIGVLGRGAASSKCLRVAAVSFLLGVIIFSGCLYALVLTDVKILGAIVPIGGVALLVGWICLACAGWKELRVGKS